MLFATTAEILAALALSTPVTHPPPEPVPVPRHEQPYRSRAQRDAFARSTVCPSTGAKTVHCPLYVVDHVIPLACGGADRPVNMQYQLVADAKFKDIEERRLCKGLKGRKAWASCSERTGDDAYMEHWCALFAVSQ